MGAHVTHPPYTTRHPRHSSSAHSVQIQTAHSSQGCLLRAQLSLLPGRSWWDSRELLRVQWFSRSSSASYAVLQLVNSCCIQGAGGSLCLFFLFTSSAPVAQQLFCVRRSLRSASAPSLWCGRSLDPPNC